MIMPEKHLWISESLISFGAQILRFIRKPRTIDELWIELEKHKPLEKSIERLSFEKLVLTLDFLFAIRAIEIDHKSKIKVCG